MRRLPAILALIFAVVLPPLAASAQEEDSLIIRALSQVLPGQVKGDVQWDPNTGISKADHGLYVQYGDTVVTADRGEVNSATHIVTADGNVRIESAGSLYVCEHAKYNLATRKLETGEFRTGRPPVFAAGDVLNGDLNGKLFTGGQVYVTGDDFSDPMTRIRASTVRIIANKSVEMWNAVVWVRGVPVFYWPYYKRNLGKHANNLNLLPGNRTVYGAYLLSTYTWYLGDDADGRIHVDYRTRRGAGAGPDLNLHMGQWGEASIRYYYLHDRAPYASTNGLPLPGPIPENRQRLSAQYQATPYTNVNVKAEVNYESDAMVEHDFFENAYVNNPQPSSFVEFNPYWDNWSLDAESMPRINTFFDQVARLPDVQLTGFSQQIANTPLYYDSQSSVGYYRRYYGETNGIDETGYSAGRADTYHQITLPWTFFNWLNIDPRAGGRLTYYSSESGPGATTDAIHREVFNTGVNTSFKASQVWAGATNSLLQVDGLRHIIEPSVDYVYIPNPSVAPNQLPQFDYDLPSLLLLPIDSSDYNNIDSIDSQNVVRFGLRNTLQTKRDGQLQNLLDWNLMLDWRLAPNTSPDAPNLGSPGPQRTFDDLYSQLSFRPRTWLTLDSQVREDINQDRVNLAFHQITFTPSERWSWGIGDWYMAGGFPNGTNASVNSISSTFYYKFDDNWGLRMSHYFDSESGRLQQQFYTLYRDFRSWTGAVTFRAINNLGSPVDYTVAFSFSLKFAPNQHVGDDTVRPYHLVGSD